MLKEKGIQDHLSCLLRNLYAGQESTLRIRHRMEWFQIGKGVYQGYILSPCLFNLQSISCEIPGWITSWQIDRKAMETVTDFLFLGFKITMDSNCSQWTVACQASFFSPSPRVCSNSYSLSWWYPINSSSVALFSSCPQTFPASGSFAMSQLFTSGGQSIRVSASASVLPVNTQGWFPLGLTGLISLLSKRLSRVFSFSILLYI